jgi:hypothetical protein
MRPNRLLSRIAAALVLSASLLPAGAVAAEAPLAGGAPPELTIAFVPVDPQMASHADGEALLDLGSVAAKHGGRGRGATVRQRVGVRLDSPAGTVAVARLQAFLATDTPGCTVRVDGVTLTAIPRTLDPVHRVGTTVVHEVEIVVPPHVPAGPFASAITWIAESL